MNIVRHLQKATLMTALIAVVTFNLVQAEPVLVSVTDPVSDNTGPVDVIGMEFEFDNETGNYRILLTTTDAEPFLVLLQHDNAGFSAPVVFRYKAQGAGNGLSPCQALQRRSGAPQERPKGWPVSVHGCVAPLTKGLRPLVARRALP